MITVLLVTDSASVIIRHYDTGSEDEAARSLADEWSAGQISFPNPDEKEFFESEWVRDSFEEQLEFMNPQYENGVRTMSLYCVGGPTEGDDRQAWVYLVPSG
jgi:hypothetical protein